VLINLFLIRGSFANFIFLNTFKHIFLFYFMAIKFGPSGFGGVKEAISNLEEYHKLGLSACEIAFTYGPYIKSEEDARAIGKAAERLGIKLSIHAPYWINLNSSESEKIEKSKERILACCKVGTWLGAYIVVFHPGYYSDDKEETFQNIKKAILEVMEESKKKGYTPKLAPETMGKVNVFGSVEEIARLVDETGCEMCIDFAHILARDKEYHFDEVLKMFEKKDVLHIHFSGIEYGELGEKKHKKTTEDELRALIEHLPRDKEFVIVNESPDPVEDSVLGLNIYSNIDSKVQ